MAKIADNIRVRDAVAALLVAAGLDPTDVARVDISYNPQGHDNGPETMVHVDLFMTDDMLTAFTSAATGDGQDEEG